MTSIIPVYFFPEIKPNNPRNLTLSPVKQKSSQFQSHNTKTPKASPFPAVYKNIASKIDTNLKTEAKNNVQDVKFEPFTWSNSTIIQQGFFSLPKISDVFPLNNKKNKSLSGDKDCSKKTCQVIEEIPDFPSRPGRRFAKVESPWKFQLATQISPS